MSGWHILIYYTCCAKSFLINIPNLPLQHQENDIVYEEILTHPERCFKNP